MDAKNRLHGIAKFVDTTGLRRIMMAQSVRLKCKQDRAKMAQSSVCSILKTGLFNTENSRQAIPYGSAVVFVKVLENLEKVLHSDAIH
jgi:hypothetical protein